MVTSAVLAGFAAGLLAALLHFAFVQKLILLGEEYETGVLVHFEGGAAAQGGHDHSTHSHDANAEETPATEGSDTNRNLLTSLFFGMTYVAFGLLLTAGFGLADSFGKHIGLQEGLLWGVACFAVVQLAPAMGLAPELPGTMASDLAGRQFWWLATVMATAAGLGLLAYGNGAAMLALGVVMLLVPHMIGAPQIDGYFGVAPPELASAFAARSLGVGLAVWAFMGAFAGHLWQSQRT